MARVQQGGMVFYVCLQSASLGIIAGLSFCGTSNFVKSIHNSRDKRIVTCMPLIHISQRS